MLISDGIAVFFSDFLVTYQSETVSKPFAVDLVLSIQIVFKPLFTTWFPSLSSIGLSSSSTAFTSVRLRSTSLAQ